MVFAELKLDMTTNIVMDTLLEQVKHPVDTIQGYINDKNPIFIIGTIGNALFNLYLQIASKGKKEGWDVHEKNAYHGSARWAREKEIYADGNYEAVPVNDVYRELVNSLSQKGEA